MSHRFKAPRPTHTPSWAKGMRKLGAGVYVSQGRQVHISEAEICERLGVPYTPDNSIVIEQVVMELMRKEFPSAKMEIREWPREKGGL